MHEVTACTLVARMVDVISGLKQTSKGKLKYQADIDCSPGVKRRVKLTSSYIYFIKQYTHILIRYIVQHDDHADGGEVYYLPLHRLVWIQCCTNYSMHVHTACNRKTDKPTSTLC